MMSAKLNANRIRELRAQHRYTQDALAFRCRVSTRTVIAWERGEKRPTARNQRRLAKVLGVTVEELRLGVTRDDPDAHTDAT